MCPLISISAAGITTDGGVARSRVARWGAAATPMWMTTISEAPALARDASSSAPRRSMARTNAAARTFVASRLSSAMSQRCAVKLKGTPDTSLASIVSVAVVEAQWACRWRTPWARTYSASQSPFGTTARFFASTPSERLPRRCQTARATSPGERTNARTVPATMRGEISRASSVRSTRWRRSAATVDACHLRGQTMISMPWRSSSSISGTTKCSALPNGSDAVT